MDSKELITKLRKSAKKCRDIGTMYHIADLMDEAAKKLEEKENGSSTDSSS